MSFTLIAEIPLGQRSGAVDHGLHPRSCPGQHHQSWGTCSPAVGICMNSPIPMHFHRGGEPGPQKIIAPYEMHAHLGRSNLSDQRLGSIRRKRANGCGSLGKSTGRIPLLHDRAADSTFLRGRTEPSGPVWTRHPPLTGAKLAEFEHREG